MSLWRAGWLLWVASGRNRIRKTLMRLREPRYLVGAALVGLYFFGLIGRTFAPSRHHPRIPPLGFDVLPYVDAVLFGIAVLVLAGTWLFRSRATLRFTEAEIQLLFPAPVSRRAILHYKLVTGLGRIGFGAIISTIFVARSGVLSPLRFWLASWLAFGTVWLHVTAASLTRGALLQHGRSGWRRRMGTVFGVALVVALLAFTAMRKIPPLPRPLEPAALTDYLTQLLATRPLAWLVLPVKSIVRVAAGRGAAFGQGLAIAGAFLVAHYVWVLRTDEAFEESALEAAERRAQAREVRGYGRRTPLQSSRIRPAWLKLSAVGRPELAIAWKNAVACQRLFVFPVVLFAASFAVPVGAVGLELLTQKTSSDLVFGVGAIAAGTAVLMSLFGPMIVRADLRQDVKQIDMLRALPLKGWQVVASEMLGPALLLALVQVSLVVSGLLLSAAGVSSVGWGIRIAAAFATILVGPLVSLAVLLVQNSAVVLFPSWVNVEPGQRGLEALGQRLLTAVGTLLVLGIGLVPTVSVGGLVYFAARMVGLPVGGVVLAAIAAAIVLVAEIAVGTVLAGKAFDTLDPSIG